MVDDVVSISLSLNQSASDTNVYDFRTKEKRTLKTTMSSFDYAYSDHSDNYRRTLNSFDDTLYSGITPYLGTIHLNALNSPYQPMYGKIISTFNNVYCVNTSMYVDLVLNGSGFLFGKNMVLTAGHVVYKTGLYTDYNGNVYRFNEMFANSIVFKPNLFYFSITTDAYVNNIIIDDKYYMDVIDEDNINQMLAYNQHNFDYDWSVLILTSNVGTTFGYCGIKTNQSILNSLNTYTYGYPIAIDANYGCYKGVMSSFGGVTNGKQYSFYENNLNFNFGGNSGGPIVSEFDNLNLPYSYSIITWQMTNNYTSLGVTVLNKYMLKLGDEYGNGWII